MAIPLAIEPEPSVSNPILGIIDYDIDELEECPKGIFNWENLLYPLSQLGASL